MTADHSSVQTSAIDEFSELLVDDSVATTFVGDSVTASAEMPPGARSRKRFVSMIRKRVMTLWITSEVALLFSTRLVGLPYVYYEIRSFRSSSFTSR